MHLTAEAKKASFKKYGKTEKNTGSPEAQVALLTDRINHMTGHLEKNKKDVSTQKALIDLVGKRKTILDYLKHNELERYRKIIKELDLRK